MVFSSFVKQARYSERILFFQSLLPYLNNQLLTYFRPHSFNVRFGAGDPHPSNHRSRFLTIDGGHYGLYYTIFNHDAEKNKKQPLLGDAAANHTETVVFIDPCLCVDEATRFVISRINQEIFNNISYLKEVSKNLLSTMSVVKPQARLVIGCRHFSTSTRVRNYRPLSPQIEEIRDIAGDRQEQVSGQKKTPQEPLVAAKAPGTHSKEPVISSVPAEETVVALEAVQKEDQDQEQPFEDSFLATQIENILNAHNNYTDRSQLNVIYPLYQSLKRNGILLPSIELYNIVLSSIRLRSLDNDESLECIETRLTSLLTVYQDVLAASMSNPVLKPNHETYSVVLGGIFKGSAEAITIGHSLQAPQVVYNEAFIKSQEFCQIGIDLLMSVQRPEKLDLAQILPALVSVVSIHPNLMSKELVAKIINFHEVPCSDGNYYVGLIALAKHFKALLVLDLDKEKIHRFVVSIFANFKQQAHADSGVAEFEYDVYSTLIQTMISNGDLSLATKFLDEILLDYKNSIDAVNKTTMAAKVQISGLISVYLETILSLGSKDNLNKAYNLLTKFNAIPYIPELSVNLHNEMINNFINEYSALELQKLDPSTTPTALTELARLQAQYYSIVWDLYNYIAIRKDFQQPRKPQKLASIVLNNKKIHCRDFLLSLSIDLGDHEKIFQLIKEVLLKNHIIHDVNVLKKLCTYLYNSAKVNNNNYYYELMCNLIENQSIHYEQNSKYLNYFVSEFSNYLLIDNSTYNSDILLNSMMVNKAFSTFKLETDNIYGLMVISNYLMSFSNGAGLNDNQLFKVLQYLSYLVAEFEDTDNHYLQLSPEVHDFKVFLKRFFVELMTYSKNIANFKYSNDMIKACQQCDLDLALNEDIPVKQIDSNYNVNLSHLLSVNYNVGTAKFRELFCKGYNFTELTWSLLMNKNFVIDVLEKNLVIKIDDFVHRILILNLEVSARILLVCNLIKLQNDKVNIHVVKYLLNNAEFLAHEEILLCIMLALNGSKNKYFTALMRKNFSQMLAVNSNKEWVTLFFENLIQNNNFEEVYRIVKSDEATLLQGLNLNDQIEEKYLSTVLLSLLNLGRGAEFNSIFKNYFNTPEKTKILTDSVILLPVLINYYILLGSFDLVLAKFKPFMNKSTEMKQLLLFAELMGSLKDGGSPISVSHEINNLAELGIAMLCQQDASAMNAIYRSNIKLVQSQELFFGSVIENLTKAGHINSKLGLNQGLLVKKFHTFVKFLASVNCYRLSVANMANVIKFLLVTKSRESLNVVANKLIFGDKHAKLFNFYFLEVLVSSMHELVQLLRALKRSFVDLDDSINLQLVEDYCLANQVRLA